MELEEWVTTHIELNTRIMYTTLPAQVVRVYKARDSEGTVVDVQTGVAHITRAGGIFPDPILEYVPIVWPGSGGCHITCSIEEGDTVLVHFSMRNSSEWLDRDKSQNIGVNAPMMNRFHDINDAFAVPASLFFKNLPAVDQQGIRLSSGATEIRILKDGTIEFGEGATERLIKGDAFLSAFLNHTHTYVDTSAGAGAVLTSGVTTVLSTPDQLGLWEDNLSEVTKTQ